MEYIKITYSDGSEWLAKWNTELKRYESESVCDENGYRNELEADQFEYSTLYELRQDSSIEVKASSRAEYWINTHKLILKKKQDEIEVTKEKLNRLISEKDEYAKYITELEQGIFKK